MGRVRAGLKNLKPGLAHCEACNNGHDGAVRILLARNNVNPNAVDSEYGGIPLSLAAEHGHEAIVRTLLERNDINPDKADMWGQIPLLLAASNGCKEVVKMLQKWKDANPHPSDTEYRQAPPQLDAALLRERADMILKHTPSLQSIEFPSLEPPELSKHPFKRTRRF